MGATGAIKAGRAFVEIFADDAKLRKGLDKAKKRLENFGKGLRTAGTKLLKLGAITGGPLAAGAKAYADFEKQMAMVSTMLDEPEKFMAGYADAIREMAVESGEGTDVLAKGLYDLLSASIAPEKAIGMLRDVVKSAKGGMTDTATATAAMVNVLNAYNIPAERAAEVSDMMFMTVKRGVVTFEELAGYIGQVTATAYGAGLSLEELGAALATMTRKGLKADQAVTALMNITSQFLKPSQEAAAAASALGIELNTATLQSEGLLGVFKKLENATPEQIASVFDNKRSLRGAMALRGDMEGFAKDVGLMANRAGTADAAYRKMTGTLSGFFSKIKQAGVQIFSVIGEAIADHLKTAGTWILTIAKHVMGWAKANKNLIVTVLIVTAAVMGTGVALIALGWAVTIAAKAFVLLKAVAVAFKVTLLALKVVMLALTTPLGMIITVLLSLGATILYVSGAGAKALSWLGERFAGLARDVADAWGGIMDAMMAGDMALAGRIMWGLLRLEFLKGVKYLQSLWLNFRNFFIKIGYDAFYGVLAAVETVGHAIEVSVIEVTSFFSKAWSKACGAVGKSLMWLNNSLDHAGNAVKGLFDSSFDKEAANRQADALYEAGTNAIDQQTRQEIEARERVRKQERDGAKRAHDATMELIGKESLAAEKALQDEYDQKWNDAEKTVRQAREEFDLARKEAAEKRKAKDAEANKKPDPYEIKKQEIKAGGQAADVAGGKVVYGTFNVMEATRLGSRGGAIDRIAKATEQTADNTKKLLDEGDADAEFDD